MVFCIDRRPHVVANDARTTAARGHRTAVGLGERYLLIGRRQNLFVNGSKFCDFNGQIFDASTARRVILSRSACSDFRKHA
jgi:hypothetical protein